MDLREKTVDWEYSEKENVPMDTTIEMLRAELERARQAARAGKGAFPGTVRAGNDSDSRAFSGAHRVALPLTPLCPALIGRISWTSPAGVRMNNLPA